MGSVLRAESGESNATVHTTWVCPRWKSAEPCSGL